MANENILEQIKEVPFSRRLIERAMRQGYKEGQIKQYVQEGIESYQGIINEGLRKGWFTEKGMGRQEFQGHNWKHIYRC